MKRSAIALCLAAAVVAAPAYAGPPKRVAVPKAAFSIDSPIRELIANPASRAALNKHMPALLKSEHLSIFENMSIRQLAASPHARIAPAKVEALQNDLVKIK